MSTTSQTNPSVKGEPARLSLMKTAVITCFPLCFPILLYLTAVLCGQRGILAGSYFCSFYSVSLVVLIAYYGVKATVSLRRTQPGTRANVVATALCVATLAWSYDRQPFLEAFEAGLRKGSAIWEVQEWAIGVLHGAKEDRTLARHDYPEWATDGRFPDPADIQVVNNEDAGTQGHVKILWGSGVTGQWGLIVGPSALPKRGRVLMPGVYFFVNPTPRGWRE